MSDNAEALSILDEESPCDTCPNFDQCATQKVACRDFFLYTNDGLLVRYDDKTGEEIEQDREPTERTYKLLFENPRAL